MILSLFLFFNLALAKENYVHSLVKEIWRYLFLPNILFQDVHLRSHLKCKLFSTKMKKKQQ